MNTGVNLKENIHPAYKEAKVVCACGETFTTKSTKPSIHVDICSKCHPFFTGKQKLVDTAGRVDRFKAKMETAQKIQKKKDTKEPKKEVAQENVAKLNEEMEEIQEELKEETVDTEPEAKSQDENKDSADK